MKRFVTVLLALYVLVCYNIIPADAANFSDVTENAWYSDAISTAEYFGVITGYPDGTFRPEQAVTRAEFATLLDRIDINKKNVAKIIFADVMDSWYTESAQLYGWFIGGSTIKFDETEMGYTAKFYPNEPIEREDAAVGLYGMLQPYLKAEDVRYYLPNYVDAVNISTSDNFENRYDEAIGTLYYLKVMTGTDGYFYPKQTLSRAEMAQIFLNLVSAGYGFV